MSAGGLMAGDMFWGGDHVKTNEMFKALLQDGRLEEGVGDSSAES